MWKNHNQNQTLVDVDTIIVIYILLSKNLTNLHFDKWWYEMGNNEIVIGNHI